MHEKSCHNCKHNEGPYCELKARMLSDRPEGMDFDDCDTSVICPDDTWSHWEAKEE